VQTQGRTWLRGNFVTDANGVAQRFNATYVAQNAEAALTLPAARAAADPVAEAVLLAEPTGMPDNLAPQAAAPVPAAPQPAPPAPPVPPQAAARPPTNQERINAFVGTLTGAAPAKAPEPVKGLTPTAFSVSPHTLGALTGFAEQSPDAAASYLSRLSEKLKAAGQTQAGAAVDALLANQQGSLSSRIRQDPSMALIFPAEGETWAQAGARRAAAPGWNQAAPANRPERVTGVISKIAGNALELTTPSGKQYRLADSPRYIAEANRNANWILPRSWVQSFVGDGPVTLQGTLGADGTTFNVEGFALNNDGRFDDFLYGRVEVAGDNVLLRTPRGNVTISNPDLKNKLKVMPILGVILPGAPEEGPQGLTYGQDPPEIFSLARFSNQQVQNPNDTVPTRWVATDMAHQVFRQKPLLLPAGQEGRVNHASRLWARGQFVFGADGKPTQFNASFIGQNGELGVTMAPAAADADPVQGAVLLTEP
jgi:hypothetical protein